MKHIKALFFFLVYLPLALSASSIETVQAYCDSMNREGLVGIVPHLHSESKAKFRSSFQELLVEAIEGDPANAIPQFMALTKGESIAEIKEWSDEKFMKRFFGFMIYHAPPVDVSARNATYVVLGNVTEKETEHVVVRMEFKMGEVSVHKMLVVSVRDDEGVPKVMLSGELEGMGEQVKNSIRMRKARGDL